MMVPYLDLGEDRLAFNDCGEGSPDRGTLRRLQAEGGVLAWPGQGSRKRGDCVMSHAMHSLNINHSQA